MSSFSQLALPSLFSFSLPGIAILRLLDCLDVSRIVLAILPRHHNLAAEDRPLGQSLAGRHGGGGGVLLLANCHVDVIDVSSSLSFSFSLSSSSPLHRRRDGLSGVNDSYTQCSVSVSLKIRYKSGADQSRGRPSRRGRRNDCTKRTYEVRTNRTEQRSALPTPPERHGEGARQRARSVLLPRLPPLPPEQHFSFHLKHRFVTSCATSRVGAWLGRPRGRLADLGGHCTSGAPSTAERSARTDALPRC